MQYRLMPRTAFEVCKDLGWTTMVHSGRVIGLITYSDEERPVYISASYTQPIAKVIADGLTADGIVAVWLDNGYGTGTLEELRKDAQSVLKQVCELHAAFTEEGFYEV